MKNPKIKAGCYVDVSKVTAFTLARLIKAMEPYGRKATLSTNPKCTRLGLVYSMDSRMLLVKASPDSTFGQRLTTELSVEDVLDAATENQQGGTITFSSQEEFILWLVNNDGKKLRNVHNNLIFYVGSMDTPFRISTDEDRPLGNYLGSLGRHWEAEYTIVDPAVEPPKEPEWYECIPEGGFSCYVSNIGAVSALRDKKLRCITKYDSASRRFISSSGYSWRYAVPLKPCDVNFAPLKPCGVTCKFNPSVDRKG